MRRPHRCARSAHPDGSDPARPELVVERAPTDAEDPGGLGLVAVGLRQRAIDLLPVPLALPELASPPLSCSKMFLERGREGIG